MAAPPQADLDTAVFDGYVSKGTKTAIQDQVEKSLKQMQGLLNSERRDHINQSTDRKAKESEIDKFLRERAAASGAGAGADDDDDDNGPAAQQALSPEAAAHHLTLTPASHTARPTTLYIGLVGRQSGHRGCSSPYSFPHAGHQPSVQRRRHGQ